MGRRRRAGGARATGGAAASPTRRDRPRPPAEASRIASVLGRLDDPAPHARVLSNGRYTVLVSGAGSGVSTCGRLASTRFAADRSEDADGFFVYLRDLEDGAVWSAGHQPVRADAERYAASSAPGRVCVTRADRGIESSLEVCVAASDDVEVRRLRVRNAGSGVRRIEVTSYAEVVLAEAAADAAHPAFAKLFVQTEYAAEGELLLARRRARSAGERHPWMVHALRGAGAIELETDRARFVGRGRSRATPRALASRGRLSGTTGNVLDPVFSLRRVATLAPGATAEMALVLGIAATRDDALACAARHRDPAAIAAVFAAAADAERRLRESLGVSTAAAEAYQELAGAMLYGHPALRADPAVIARSAGSAARLAAYGVRGGALLVVAAVEREDDLAHVGDLCGGARYWRAKTLAVDVVLACRGGAGLVERARRAWQAAGGAAGGGGADGAIVLDVAAIAAADLDALQAAAHLVVARPLAAIATSLAAERSSPAAGRTDASVRGHSSATPPAGARVAADDGEQRGPLVFPNGFGGFTPDGREYVMRVAPPDRDGAETAARRCRGPTSSPTSASAFS